MKVGGVTPCDPQRSQNAQITQACSKKRKKYSNTCDARVIITTYSNPRKESIPPPQKRTESVTARPLTRSITSGQAQPNSWASVALTNCSKNCRLDVKSGISIRNTRDARVIDSGTANAHRVGDSHTAMRSLTAGSA